MSLGMLFCSECRKPLCMTASRLALPPLICFFCEPTVARRIEEEARTAAEYKRLVSSQENPHD